MVKIKVKKHIRSYEVPFYQRANRSGTMYVKAKNRKEAIKKAHDWDWNEIDTEEWDTESFKVEEDDVEEE